MSKVLKGGRVRAGVSLVEVAMGLGIMGVVALGVMQVTSDQSQSSRALSAAVQLDQVRAATHDWMRANYPQLAANLPVGGNPVMIPVARTTGGGAVPGPVVIGGATIPSLQGGGFLPAAMVDRNAYGHSHAVMVRQTAAGNLEALVMQAGGQAVRDADLGRIVQRVGNAGGARFATNTNPAMATMVQGNAGSWTADSGVWTAGGFTPQVSRAAASVSFGNAAMLSDFVNRYDIGIPEANTMRTALNMGANDLTNAATVRANQAVLQNGGMACAGNAAGCAFWISDDGRFADFNDGWVRFQAMSAGGGLAVEGPAGGGNLSVSGNSWTQGNVGSAGTGWFQAGVGTNGNAWVGGAGSFGSDVSVGRNLGVAGFVGAAQVWTGYLNSSGSVDTQTLNVGQSAAIWGAGGLWVANTLSVGGSMNLGGNLTTPNSIRAGYIRSEGSVDAAGDLNALRQNGLGGNVTAWGVVRGVGGVQTMTWRTPNTWCNWGGGEAGLIAVSTANGGLLNCTSAWLWTNAGGGFEGRFDRQIGGQFWNGAYETRTVFVNPYGNPVFASIYVDPLLYQYGGGGENDTACSNAQALVFASAFVDGRFVGSGGNIGTWVPAGGTLQLQSLYHWNGSVPSDSPLYSGPYNPGQCMGAPNWRVDITR